MPKTELRNLAEKVYVQVYVPPKENPKQRQTVQLSLNRAKESGPALKRATDSSPALSRPERPAQRIPELKIQPCPKQS